MDITALKEFDCHEEVLFVSDRDAGLHGYIAIHCSRGNSVPSLGATRLWSYETPLEALRDALRLARLMSHKSALAGLPYGGAKAALLAPRRAGFSRSKLFRAYANRVNTLSGHFITGTDVGVTDGDVKFMKRFTPYVIGRNVDPAFFTAQGVLSGIRTALKKVYGSDDVSERSFAIQGVGKTGRNLLRLLAKNGARKIFIADIDKQKAKKVRAEFPRITIVSPGEIHRQNVDVFSPAALSGVLNLRTVPQIRAKIVAGSANNQLSGPGVGNLLARHEILYAPDYVINAGGLISVADEFANPRVCKERIVDRIGMISKNLGTIFDRAIRKRESTQAVADEMAEQILHRDRQ
ncbi:MAG: Glu/Leu/Phe/Val dehydrogenase dimerization domain-containing protein [Candidatus Liptonbacteria bacterium]